MIDTPSALGYRMPAEWEPHQATWIAWPHNRDDWPGKFAPVPWVSEEAAQAITGKSVDEETASAAGRAAVRKARPLSQNDYKTKLASVAVKRALLLATGQTIPDLHSAKTGGAA